ncbi:hypothetical protein [Lentiprolixibacter aurantiacus]|uniref:Cytochrome c domain-containing protein n=1 Tax=Lentiprolixibacter aurantiacus TaxID=2993939 RepID=A0AAE3MMD2_9FLAO|nr:hypothetical protein [Lentiprolixibacter aurantiacus]MCX2720371.1 hypothetical protein [Lentiprolixibacter aurantiacus]
MKKNALLILAGCLLLFSSSCYYDELPPVEEIEIAPDIEDTFNEDILPILSKYDCTQCHNASLNPDLRPQNALNSLIGDGYVVAGDASASIFFQRLPGNTGSDHPPVGISLTASEISTIENWINGLVLE